MRVDVEGNLKSKMKRSKHKLLRFCSTSGDRDNSMLTRIDLSSAPTTFKRKLDTIAKGLEWAMHEENMQAVPVEIPRPAQATFEQLPFQPDDDRTADARSSSTENEPQNADLEELSHFLHQPICASSWRSTLREAESVLNDHDSTNSENTLLNDEGADHERADEAVRPSHLVWRIPEVMALALIRWLLLLLKSMGTDRHADLSAVPVIVGQANNTTNHDQRISQDVKRLKIELRDNPLLTAVVRSLLTSSATTNLSDGLPLTSQHINNNTRERRRMQARQSSNASGRNGSMRA